MPYQDHKSTYINPDAQGEAAAAADRRDEFKRIKQLTNVATDILNIIYERTKGTREARYVADFAQASIKLLAAGI